MTTNFDELNRDAAERGMRDYERGIPITANPFRHIAATEERIYWRDGWVNSEELDDGKKPDNAISHIEVLEGRRGGLYIAVFKGPVCVAFLTDPGQFGTMADSVEAILNTGVLPTSSSDPAADYNRIAGGCEVVFEWTQFWGLVPHVSRMKTAARNWVGFRE